MKSASTNDLYQSTFMPIFEKAETRIKSLILVAFLFGTTEMVLLYSLAKLIKEVSVKIPADLSDRNAYIKGLEVKTQYYVNKYYKKAKMDFFYRRQLLVKSAPLDKKLPKLETPRQFFDFVKNPKNLWAEAKGNPNVTNYPKQLKTYINKLASDPLTTAEPGKKPISLWQKAELDVRYYGQMQNLQDLRVKGVELAYISSHANCSKRCEKFQGCLVDLKKHSIANPPKKVNSYKEIYKKDFVTGDKVDGVPVYSLPDIMEVEDKYGYHNNIICGFNCRHRLIPYTGQLPPTKYDKDDVAKQRNIEIKIREIERTIRLYKQNELLYNKSGMLEAAHEERKKWKALVEYYKKFCEANGYAWHEYRIKI